MNSVAMIRQLSVLGNEHHRYDMAGRSSRLAEDACGDDESHIGLHCRHRRIRLAPPETRRESPAR